MDRKCKHITVFEHETLRIDRGEKRISNIQLEALQQFYGESGVPYYSLIHHGVKFNEYVGVLQIGDMVIEVLPKADRNNDSESWRRVLIGMLNAVGIFDIHAPCSSNLNLRMNSILDLYFEFFIKELEYLMHRGLIKKYRKTEGNKKSLKGSLKFSKHISQNIVHQERFYVQHTTYDKEHTVHAILYKALKLLSCINTNMGLSSRLGALLLDFPEQKDIKVTESLFEKIVYDRKTEHYKNTIEIARLILLNYHPDVRQGSNNILALMFDMNLLWEQFVFVTLRKHKSETTTIAAQNTKSFWKPDNGYKSKMKPDIVLNKGREDCIVLDTKWKNLNGFNPSPEDLRQMFVYMKYYNAKKVALVYPGLESKLKSGKYYEHDNSTKEVIGTEECSLISVAVNDDIKVWQCQICKHINLWAKLNN